MDSVMGDTAQAYRFNRTRPTIGLLTGWAFYGGTAPDWFLEQVYLGALAAGKEFDCNLLLACGIIHIETDLEARPAWPIAYPDADFVPIGPENTDCLVVLTPLLSAERSAWVRALAAKGFPLVSVGEGEGLPSVVVDNKGGILDAMRHLTIHGHRQIAFIAGDPGDPGDSLQRLTAYRQGLEEFDCDHDPRLVEYGRHKMEYGCRAMESILQSGANCTAVIASDDASAIGAMRAIRQAGRRIPQDIAVIGFDDQLQAAGESPPLTTIHYPLFETGQRAVQLAFDLLRCGKGETPDRIEVPTWLAIRQSCGCLPGVETLTPAGAISRSPEGGNEERGTRIAKAMAASLLTKARRFDPETAQEHCRRWVEVFSHCLSAGDPSELRTTVQETLDRAEEAGEDLHTWQIAVAAMRQGVLAAKVEHAGAEDRQRAEDYLQLVRVVVAEAAERQHRRSKLQANYVLNQLGWMISNLFAAREERQVFLALSRYLPAIGIRSTRVALFEQQEDDPVAVYRMLVPSEAPSALTDPTGDLCVIDRTRDFPPAAAYPANRRFQLSLLPVIVHEAAVGFAAIDSDQFENGASIVRELGAALESVRLHREVLELSLTDELTGVHNRRYFDIFLQREVEHSRRFGRGMALILVDLDNLKEYNDRLGHKYGDEALQLTANCITNSARRGSDCVVRFGGDEFAVVLPETDIEATRRMAEDIRRSTENQFLAGHPLTVSVGVVFSMKGELSVTDLVHLADQALYSAKKGGRNRVWMVDENA